MKIRRKNGPLIPHSFSLKPHILPGCIFVGLIRLSSSELDEVIWKIVRKANKVQDDEWRA